MSSRSCGIQFYGYIVARTENDLTQYFIYMQSGVEGLHRRSAP